MVIIALKMVKRFILLVWFFDRSFIVDTVNLRQLSFGKRTFRGLVSSALTMCGKWMYNSINRIDMPRLESLSFGDSCLSKLDRFVLLSMNNWVMKNNPIENQCLKNLTFGKGCLKNCQYFVLLSKLYSWRLIIQ